MKRSLNLDKMTIRQILESYPFSRRFIVSFALDCAKDVAHLTKDPTETAKWFVVIEGYMQGRNTKIELTEVINDAYAASAANATAHAAYAANAANAAAYAANATAHAAYAAYAANATAHAAYAANAANATASAANATAHAAYAANAANAAAYAANATAHAAYAANAANATAHAANAAAHAANATANAASKEDKYKQRLIKKIKNLSEFQQLLLGIVA